MTPPVVPEAAVEAKGFCECGCGGRTSLAKSSDSKRGLVAGQPRRFLHGHNRRAELPTDEARFWQRVKKRDDGCWEWTGTKNHAGYGDFWDGSRLVRAHRYGYELLVGPIPEGLQLDHLCRVRECVNPEHLEPVTARENTRRAASLTTHCPQGHPYAGEHLYLLKGRRLCRTCRRLRQRGQFSKAQERILRAAAAGEHSPGAVRLRKGWARSVNSLVEKGLGTYQGRKHKGDAALFLINDAGRRVLEDGWSPAFPTQQEVGSDG